MIKLEKYNEMIQYCKENNITNYAEFVDYCNDNKYDWFKILCDETEEMHIMVDYFKELPIE